MVDKVRFNGILFRRYPDSTWLAQRNYYTPGIADRQRGIQHLHVEVWKSTHGRAVPEGHEIHHADFNPLNNDPSNLVCLTRAEHKEAHREQGRLRGHAPERLAMLDRVRPLAAAWHSSPEGVAWHREHAAKSGFGKVEPRPAVCEQCGADYLNQRAGESRFCSNNCKSAWRRASGVDDVERECAGCRVIFIVNRYVKKTHCTRICASDHRHARARAGLQPDGR